MSSLTINVDLRGPLRILSEGENLNEAQAWQTFEAIMAGQATDAQIGAVLTALAVRPGGPSIDELTGAARAMRNHAMKIDVPVGIDVIDTCGTGGDHSGTFNISTVAALIAAGAGAYVAKHGNRSVTSASGSSQVLEALGVQLEVGRQTLTECLLTAHICFCFAPNHHPAMKHAIGPRRELGFRTIFNVLGPLTNPAGATRQLLGVYSEDLTEPLAEVLLKLGTTRAMIVHGSTPDGGLDEIATTGPTRITEIRNGEISSRTITPKELGVPLVELDALRVSTVEESAEIISGVLTGETGPTRDIACVNAAAALVVADLAADLPAGIRMAEQSIDDGAAQAALDQLVHVTNNG